MVHNLWHTVLCTLHHHTATKDSTEVCTLQGVHRTAGIDRDNTVLLPISRIRIFLTRFWISQKDIYITDLDTFKQRQQVIDGQRRSLRVLAAFRIVGCSVLVRTLQDTLIPHLIVIGFTGRKFFIRIIINFRN